MSLAATIAIFLVVLGVLVVVHELGHFLTAKRLGIKVHEFGLGYPPRLFGVRRGETMYSLNLLPLGGFVRLAGEDDPRGDPDIHRTFAARPPWQRFLVLVAGPGMNALLPMVLFAAVAMVPRDILAGDVVVRDVAPGSPAAAAGVQPGDVIREINGRPIRNHAELDFVLRRYLGSETRWLIQRDGATTAAVLTPRWRPPEGQGATGVRIATGVVSVEAVASGSPAAVLGLRPGDLLLGVGGVPVFRQEHVALVLEALAERGDTSATVVLWRDGQVAEVTAPIPAASPATALDGLDLDAAPPVRETIPAWAAVPAGLERLLDILVVARNEVYRWIIGAAPPQVAGPVGIAQLTGEVAQAGFLPLLEFMALLSLNLAILNILPIPALDGGRLVFVVFEWVARGRRVPPEKEGLVHLVGFALLMGLAAVITYLDIARIMSGESFIR